MKGRPLRRGIRQVLSCVMSLTMVVSLLGIAPTVVGAATETIKIACVGDSITAGFKEGGFVSMPYPSQLASRMGSGYEVRNFGNSGKTVNRNCNDAYSKTDTYTESLAYNPDVVIIMLGTNDARGYHGKVTGSISTGEYISMYKDELKWLISQYAALSSKPKILLATSPADNGGHFASATIVNEIVPMQKEVAEELDLPIVDTYALTKGQSSWYIDQLHFNNTGYSYFADTFASALQKNFGLLPGTEDVDGQVGRFVSYEQTVADGNVLLFNCGNAEVKLEFCTDRTVRVQLSANGSGNYRPVDPEYYMVQKTQWDPVKKTVSEDDTYIRIKTDAMEVRVQKSPFRIGMYDLEGNLISKDSDTTGMYWDNSGNVGVRKSESATNAGGIFGFGSGDHGRRSNLNRYNEDFNQFTMSHGRLVSPFFMSTVGYGIFLNTIEKQTTFYKQGGGFQTKGYLDYFFMYGPDFKTILNEYAEITGRMELYGKWAHGFMLSKYGNDNATQAEFLQWLHTLRDQGYPADVYVFDYGWRGDVADNGGDRTGAGEKFGKQMWSNDKNKFPDIAAMFAEADELGFHVGLHNNAGTPEASGGKELYKKEYSDIWVKSYMDSVITTGYGDFFWPDEFDVLGSNTAPVLSSKDAYEAWQEYTDQSRPMFMTRGNYAGQHYATAWSGDIEPTSTELINQIGFSIDAGLVGYWAVSHDLGGFMSRPSDALYTRWVSEFGAWNGLMRTHGHDGREPWTFDQTAQTTLKENLKIRYALYPYTYSLAWQGYSQGVPIMRAMLLEDDSQYNPDAWTINQQYYYGDYFLVAPAAATNATTVSVWLPPETTWYDYATGERFEGGADGKTITVAADLDEIPVFVKAGAIVPMGPDVNYADEKPLDPLTLDIYPHEGTTSFTLYEDDGETREYITKDAYSTTTYESTLSGDDITFVIGDRVDHNSAEYLPDARNYNLKFNHVTAAQTITIDGKAVSVAKTLDAYNAAEQAYYVDSDANALYVKTPDTGKEIKVALANSTIELPELGEDNQGVPPTVIRDGERYELENATMTTTNHDGNKNMVIDTEWKGYTGAGFAKGFKFVGDKIEFTVNILEGGDYNLALRVNCGKKNDSRYDNSPRQGTLYIDGNAYPMSFAVTDTWGNSSSKAGDWRDYAIENVALDAGEHNIKFVVEGDVNPGNYNLDSLTFNRIDRSIAAFSPIEAEIAAQVSSATVTDVADAQGGKVLTMEAGGAAEFAEVKGAMKNGVILRAKSSDGGTITVFENGVGDKVLTTIEIPADGAWHELTVTAKDTDLTTSDIWLSYTAEEGDTCQIDWWRFTQKKSAYLQIEAESADQRQGIDLKNGNTLNHIENGDWAMYRDLDFGESGAATFGIRAALGNTGGPGTCSVYLDSLTGTKIAEATINYTANWDSYQTFTAECTVPVTGVHTIYLVFNSTSTKSICDANWFIFEEIQYADYTAVDAALDKVPANLTIYTEESAAKVIAAVEAVVRGKRANEQAVVDGYAAAILAAVADLEVKPEIAEKIDFSLDISDGVVTAGEETNRRNITWNATVKIGENTTLDAINENIKFKEYGVIYGMDEASVQALADGKTTANAKKVAFDKGDNIDVYTVFGFRLKGVAANRSRAAMFYITYEVDGVELTLYSPMDALVAK